MKLVYPAIFEPNENGKGFSVEFPDLPGCITCGDDMSEAMEMAVDAASGWVLSEMEDGNEIPEASALNEIGLNSEEFIVPVLLNMDEYAEKYGEKAIKKTLTIPAWQNTYVEKNNISCSHLLQNAIDMLVKKNRSL